MSTEQIEVDSGKLKALLNDWSGIRHPIGSPGRLAADILARNPHLSEIEVTVRLTRVEVEARAAREKRMAYGSVHPSDTANDKLDEQCRAKLAEFRP